MVYGRRLNINRCFELLALLKSRCPLASSLVRVEARLVDGLLEAYRVRHKSIEGACVVLGVPLDPAI